MDTEGAEESKDDTLRPTEAEIYVEKRAPAPPPSDVYLSGDEAVEEII